MALVFDRPAEDTRLREALGLSIDRTAMHNVLLQRQGEIAGGLLPQWLTGYAFLFPTAQDLPRARQLVAAIRASARQLSLAYDASDPVARSVADRIAVNAREASIVLQVSPQAARPDVRLMRPMPGLSLFDALHNPEVSFATERAILASLQMIPLFHLPQTYGLSPRLKNWMASRWGEWRLDDVFLDPEKP